MSVFNRVIKAPLFVAVEFILSACCSGAIIYPKAPEGGQEMVLKSVSEVLPKLAQGHHLIGVRLDDLVIAKPFQIYFAWQTNWISGEFLSTAKYGIGGGWQYLVTRGTNVVLMMSVNADEQTGKALKCLVPLYADPANEDFTLNQQLQALRLAEQLPQAQTRDYEVRWLAMPWISFAAVWLHGKSDDIIIPLPDSLGRWKGFRPYSEKGMANTLREVDRLYIKHN
jgi:hypothetical protein